MYNETGNKIKTTADTMATFGVLKGVGVGILMFFAGMILAHLVDENDAPLVMVAAVILSIIVAIAIGVSAWRKHLLFAGFGELIEKTSKVANELLEIKESIANSQAVNSKVSTSKDDADIPQWKALKNGLDQGIITEEEYNYEMKKRYD